MRYLIPTHPRAVAVAALFFTSFLLKANLVLAQPANDHCSAAVTIVTNTSCVNGQNYFTGENILGADATASIPSCGSGNTSSADMWYKFVAQTAYPVISLSNIGSNLRSSTRGKGAVIHLLSAASPCSGFTSLACASSGTSSSVSLNTATSPGGAGLTVGATYYIRIHTNNNTTSMSGTTGWNFDICVTDPTPGRIEYSRSYINVSKMTTGGTVSVGDTVEMRATLVLFSGSPNASLDSLSYSDTLFNNNGYALIPGTIALRTNEGLVYRADQASKVPFTDAFDSDAGYYYKNGADTIIRINFGAGASGSARGQLSNTSRPSVFGSTCIIMATYRVRVYAPFNSKLSFKTGGFTARDRATGTLSKLTFKTDSLVVYKSPGLCPNAVSATNAIGVENNGTFGYPTGSAPLERNRGTSSYVPTYIYSIFRTGNGPNDYYYGIANNTSASFTTNNALLKPDAGGYRVFNLWDITGDHTGATNTAKGNPPCDTTKPRSATNPCGYMLVINSSYRPDTAFQYTVTNLCPNTYYEISTWLKNICSKCSSDSLGKGSTDSGYQAGTPGDTSGVKPNIAFDVNGVDYYTTGDIPYKGLLAGTGAQAASDSTNQWLKRGFVYLTDSTQTSFTLTLRNNAPGGGGNDWALDDIAVSTCLPNMKYSPSLNPDVCRLNALTIYDTITSYFDNYVYYKWQRSTDGVNWTDVTGPLGPATPTNTGSGFQYVTSYTVPPALTDTSNNGDMYRVVVATTSSNLSSASCLFTDGVSIITLNVLSCGIPLDVNILSFSGRVANDHAALTWSTTKEEGEVTYTVEKSLDGANFTPIALINGLKNNTSVINTYNFTDPSLLSSKAYYRILLTEASNHKKYSRTIQLGNSLYEFEITSLINPFTDRLSFTLTSPGSEKVDVSLTDMLGKVIRHTTALVNEGSNMLEIAGTQQMLPGMYILQVSAGDKTLVRKVVKKN